MLSLLDPGTMIIRLSLLTGALSLAISTTLQAQATDTARIAPMVSTATRVPVSRESVPASVSVISGDALRAQGVTRIADALRQVPGVALAQTGSFGGTTSLFLRGGESKYVKVLVDGVPVNDPGGAFDFGTLTVDNIERIEVVRGPASVLYGADAVTGVIQVFTKRGAGRAALSLDARAGGYDTRDVNASMSGAPGAASYSLGVAHHTTSGIYDFNSGYRNNVVSGAFRFAPDDRTSLGVTLRYTDYAFHYPTSSSGDVVDSNAMRAEDKTTIGVEANRQFNDRLSAHLTLSSHLATGGTDDQPQANIDSRYVSLDDVRRRGANGWVDVALPFASTLTLGTQIEQEDQRSQSQSSSSGFDFNSLFKGSRSNKAAYGQLLLQPAGTIVVSLGARHDDNERFGGFTTYRTGASWRVLAATRLRASVGSGFREPTFYENYATGFVTGNPDLRPEQSRSWEIGVQQSFLAERVSLAGTYYHQEFRDMIDYTGDTDACGASYCNVARARASGQEIEATVIPIDGLRASASLSHVDTRVLRAGFDLTSGGLYHAGQALIRRPRTSWSGGLAYARPNVGSLDLQVNWVGARGDRDFRVYPSTPVMLPAYTLVDLGAEAPIMRQTASRPGTALTLRVENLADVKYQSVFNYRTPRRTLLVGMRLNF